MRATLIFNFQRLTYRRKDRDCYRLYRQLTTNLPTNDSALELLRYHSFYDLYWLMTTNIFGTYGVGSSRAEAELAKMMLLPVTFGGKVPHDTNSWISIYQSGRKKVFITLNEFLRETTVAPKCIAAGHDRHVKKLATLFSPYNPSQNNSWIMFLCQTSSDWVLWNLNEYVGQLQQCLRSGKGSRGEQFAVKVFTDLLNEYPDYQSLVQKMVSNKRLMTEINSNLIHQPKPVEEQTAGPRRSSRLTAADSLKEAEV